jgi:hypothetical protein
VRGIKPAGDVDAASVARTIAVVKVVIVTMIIGDGNVGEREDAGSIVIDSAAISHCRISRDRAVN